MIECAVKEDILLFEANEFSTYAIVYKDTIKILNNNDNDSKENSTSSEKTEDNKLEAKLLEVHNAPEKEQVSVSAKIAPTGDENSSALWVGTLVLSSLALCTVVISKRKQQNK